jgi:uncharacterized protein (DUF934 family)
MPKLIKRDAVIDDAWTVVPAGATLAGLPDGPVIVPLALFRAEREALVQRGNVGVWLAPADEPGELRGDLGRLSVVAVDFPKFGDGRGFSTARLLRDRYGYTGELRAIGDVFRDQLFYMAECGFDAFAVRADLDPAQEIAGLATYERTYARSTRTPRPWFRQRAEHVAAAAPGDVWFPCA